MEEFKVLITTSGLGTRLGELTNFTNKSLVRISEKPAISHIIESYPKDTKFVITLGHFGDHVQQFLELAYPNINFEFVRVDKFSGQGSSLGYSISKCKENLKCPFIFHASDTIINDYCFSKPDSNYIIGSKKNDSSQYRTIQSVDDFVLNINEKGDLNFDLIYVGVSGINKFELFFEKLNELLNTEFDDISDVHVINRMLISESFQIKKIESKNWFDVGNVTELMRTKKFFKSEIEVLDKVDESIFFFENSVIKFFSDEKINLNRVKRTQYLQGLVPNILNFTKNFYKYEKVDGLLFSKSVKKQSFLQFLDWSKKHLWVIKKDNNIKKKCYEFYVNKTKKRVDDFLKNNKDPEIINGIKMIPIFELISQIDYDWLSDGISTSFHGDFILDNVIQTFDGFCLIDWRQDFSEDLESGDIYYDLAKLNHNMTINHEIVNKKLFDHSSDNCHILTNSKLNECKELLQDFILKNSFDLKKVNVLTSIIWLNMSPLHEYPFNNFLFNYGKYNLYKYLKL